MNLTILLVIASLSFSELIRFLCKLVCLGRWGRRCESRIGFIWLWRDWWIVCRCRLFVKFGLCDGYVHICSSKSEEKALPCLSVSWNSVTKACRYSNRPRLSGPVLLSIRAWLVNISDAFTHVHSPAIATSFSPVPLQPFHQHQEKNCVTTQFVTRVCLHLPKYDKLITEVVILCSSL